MFHALPETAFAEECQMQIGALCWRVHLGKTQVLLITSRDTGRWIIPKGWTMDGVPSNVAAAREAWEEAGVEGEVNPDQIGQFNYDKILSPDAAVRCQVTLFGLRVTKLAKRFPERKQRRRKWFSLKAAALRVNEPDLRSLIADLPAHLADVSQAPALAVR